VPKRRQTINFPSWGNPFRKPTHPNLYLHTSRWTKPYFLPQHTQPMPCVVRTATTASESLHKTFQQDSRLLWLTNHLIGSCNTDQVLVFVGTLFQHTYRSLSKRHITSSSLLPASSHVSTWGQWPSQYVERHARIAYKCMSISSTDQTFH